MINKYEAGDYEIWFENGIFCGKHMLLDYNGEEYLISHGGVKRTLLEENKVFLQGDTIEPGVIVEDAELAKQVETFVDWADEYPIPRSENELRKQKKDN